MRRLQSSIRNSVLCLFVLANSVSAASLYFQGAQGPGGNNVWSWASVAQQSYSSSLFASLGPSIDITAISFQAFPNDSFRPGNSWTMTIGVVPNAVAHMSNVATSNLPLADAHFFATESFPTSLYADRSLVTFHGDFVYTPADGDLVWQIQANGPIGGPAYYYGSSPNFGIYWYADGSSIDAHGAHGYNGQLLNTFISVPEPSTLILGSFGSFILVACLRARRGGIRAK